MEPDMDIAERMLLIIPSRGRHARLIECLNAIDDTATSGQLDVLVLLDEDDAASYVVHDESTPPMSRWVSPVARIDVIPGPQRFMVPKLNWAVEQYPGYGWYGFMGDDHQPRTSGWDQVIIDTLTAKPGVAYGNDLLQGANMATAAFITGSIIDALGFMAPPTLQHLYCDNFWMRLGQDPGSLHFLPDVIIEHVHYQNGKAEEDDTYRIANAPERYEHDQAAWEEYVHHDLAADIRKARGALGLEGICVLVTTDGRLDYLAATIASFEEQVTGPITSKLIHDDSGDPEIHDALRRLYPGWGLVMTPGRSGYGGARRHAWDHIRRHVQEQLVFLLEDDFTFERPADLRPIQQVLLDHPHLTQMAFRRQGWSGPEIEAGGVVELRADEFTDRHAEWWQSPAPDDGPDVAYEHGTYHWLEHRLFWTSNPSLIPRWVIDTYYWPDTERSEAQFAHEMFTADTGLRAGYWGPRSDPPWVFHIGNERHPSGWGY